MDLLLSFPSSSSTDIAELPIPIVTLLEFNASPDFVQSGERLKPMLEDMFKGVVHIAIAPFFGIGTRDQGEGGRIAQEGKADILGWVKIGEGQVRGPT